MNSPEEPTEEVAQADPLDSYPHPWGGAVGTVGGVVNGIYAGEIDHDPGGAGAEGAEAGSGADSE